MQIDPHQETVATMPADTRAFLEGPAGTGKTTAGVARLRHFIASGVPGNSILVIVPQRTLALPYSGALRQPDLPARAEVTLLTIGGIAQRMMELFWPLVADAAGFAHPDRPPSFLTLETAQYYMARLVGPMLERGYFDSVVISRNRLYSQILDNLNKAAAVGFPYEEIGARLKAAWTGESSQARVYDEAQDAASAFRQYCLAHNLLDFSVQYETFAHHIWPLPACRELLLDAYRHIIVDNVEEDTPVAHDILLEWLPRCRSALVISDSGGGYRRFLGADPESARRLRAVCVEHFEFSDSYVTSTDTRALVAALSRTFGRSGPRRAPESSARSAPVPASAPGVDGSAGQGVENPLSARMALDLPENGLRFYPEMLDWVAQRIGWLVHEEGVPPGQIVVLAPFLTGALRFSLEHSLERLGVATRSHRPSRALREEPPVQCLLTLAALCHPGWGIRPDRSDVAHALMLAIEDMDLVRAHLLASIAYRDVDGLPALSSFTQIEPDVQERITFLLGGRFEGLRTWLNAHVADGRSLGTDGRWQRELDHFLARLFGELLSQPGYGFHGSYDAGEITAVLIESARKFRQVMVPDAAEEGAPSLAQEYVRMVREGVVAAQYVRSWARQPQDAVLLAPAYTFLMSNQAVDHQFWLDVGSTGWWERLYQPLTHPYVLSRPWLAGAPRTSFGTGAPRTSFGTGAPRTSFGTGADGAPPARVWTDAEEYAARQDALACLVLGLVRRCRKQIHLGLSELGEAGNEARGPLLQAIQQVLRRAG